MIIPWKIVFDLLCSMAHILIPVPIVVIAVAKVTKSVADYLSTIGARFAKFLEKCA
jgi:hypothetical protein